jgi:hypothetical protein
MIKYKKIKKEQGNLGTFLKTLLKKEYGDWGKYQELFNGIEYVSWAEFEGAINDLNKYLKGKKISSNENRPLYRGQCCGKWNLETTLERYTDNKYTIMDYLKLIQSAKCAYESHFSKGYETEEIDIEKIKYDIWSPHPHYSLLPYFRHLGLPSPLLDWTRSFYVAAYFAFCDANQKDDNSVAIYSYIENFRKGTGKDWNLSEGHVNRIGSNIGTHKRHYLQQAEYTYAVIVDELPDAIESQIDNGVLHIDCNKVRYINHDQAITFSMGVNRKQDIFVKHLIPITEKDAVITRLSSMNINEYSLFHTEESLMTTVAYERIRRK